MLSEDYVSYDTAKLLKQKGSWEDIDSVFCISIFKGHRYILDNGKEIIADEDVDIPTLQMAMKWLREKYKIFISIQQHMDMSYVWYIYEDGTGKGCDRESHNNSYEQAAEAAIKYCLENLI